MNNLLAFILAGLQITLLDLVLSGDNVGVIALAIRNLNTKQAKLASIVGVSSAICLRIFFASIVTLIMGVEWLPIRLVGGILLLKITWDLVNNSDAHDSTSEVKSAGSFKKAVFSIIIADVSMSLDNVLAIGGSADGHIGLIVFGILLNIPILLFGSRYVAKIMQTHKIAIFVGAGLLLHTAITMIMEDRLVSGYVNHIFTTILSWSAFAAVILFGYYKTREKVLIK